MTTIVMTGRSSGFGAIAAQRLAHSSETRLITGERSPSADAIALDLASLESVRAFAVAVRELLGENSIVVLVLNAGTILPDTAGRTVDGYETGFAVNHLAHYLLLRLLLPSLAEKGRIVLTTSGTHDPATGAGLALPRHADAELLAHPDRDPGVHPNARTAGQHAYTASKLCTVLTVRALNANPDIRSRHITALAYDPGQVFGTGLARDLALPFRIAWSVLGTPVGAPLRRFNRTVNTREAAANALADLALGTVTPPPGRTYAALRHGEITWPDPSELARRDDLASALWDDSARLVGLAD
ncbi:SDR family NAD(P)-dependent oxidoreductase [Nocardia otitidiscaviarum]|uniref:SDR family NAD(P)-dependent oxidoreductase n=1 Tax=Nocardia otitidiscaviarum TaxID=1823 RepID=UPI0018935EE3|nr:SDR family NAD(P)-dependent oxidoreductase [Nocardia otitidiscaviarum]MBF6180768.1 SDR family NAD(P)-dependent oxidoreductase [Nocardia otitidiscaviarum]